MDVEFPATSENTKSRRKFFVKDDIRGAKAEKMAKILKRSQ